VLVPVGDVDALGDAIVGLACDPARRARLGAAARERVLAEFSLPHALDRCETALEQIARR
jgi:glycosyltransferase involved in cell wall biosynthesis